MHPCEKKPDIEIALEILVLISILLKIFRYYDSFMKIKLNESRRFYSSKINFN